MTDVARRPSVRRVLWLGGTAVVLLAAAAFSRNPGSPGVGRGEASTLEVPRSLAAGGPALAPAVTVPWPSEPAGAQSQEPYFTPFTVAPRLKNGKEAGAALEAAYPAALRDAGIGGTAVLWFFIDEKGAVRQVRVEKGTGYPALDAAAVSVAKMMEFTPAKNGDRVVPVWVSIPIVFGPSSTEPPVLPLPPPAERAAANPETIAQGPTFTPFTVAPRLRNQADVARTLEANYPPLLRDAGIGGSVDVWFFIDVEGRVLKTQVNRSSSYPALDEAALRVAETMRFTPARNRDEAVPVWVSVPISFHVK